MKKYFAILGVIIILLFLPAVNVYGSELEDYNDFDYSQVQEAVDDIMGTGESFSFQDYVSKLISGEEQISPKGILSDIKTNVMQEIKYNASGIIKLMAIAVIAAIFTNFSGVFQNNQISDTSFYVTYLLLFTTLTTTFLTVSNIAGDALANLFRFVKAMVPTYFLAIAFCSGSRTSMIFYESTLVMIAAVNFILLKMILPLINVYVVLTLANNLSAEDYLSKYTELIGTVIRWTLKTLLGAVIGLNAIQAMIVPAVDAVKKNFLMKAAGSIPGVGNALETVTKTVVGAGILVKNAIGVAGLVVILVIIAVPMIKLVIYVLLYKLGTAVVQPITDKRIIGCMGGVTEAAGLLLYTVFIGVVLFMVTIAIITTSTNTGLGG